MSLLPYLLAAWLFVIGLYGVVTSRHLVHLVICLSVMQSSTYVLLLALGYRNGKKAPIFTSGVPVKVGAVDPVVIEIWKRAGTVDPDALRRQT